MVKNENQFHYSKILLQASSSSRAELLRNQLLRVDDTFEVELTIGNLEKVRDKELDETAILSISDQFDASFAWLEIAKKLRTELFYWNPIHICVTKELSKLDLENDWAIYLYKSPANSFELAKSIKISGAMVQTRRREIVFAALMSITNEVILSLKDSKPAKEPLINRVQSDIERVLNLISAIDKKSCPDILNELEQLLKTSSLSENGIVSLIPLVVRAENELRDESRSQQIASALHRLNNGLRLFSNGKDDFSTTAKDLLLKIEFLLKRGLGDLNNPVDLKVQEFLLLMRNGLQFLHNSVLDTKAREEVLLAASEIYTIVNTFSISSGELRGKIERIVLIEDDADWHNLIRDSLDTIAAHYQLPVESGKTIAEAKNLLSKPETALVLVDLGLPLDRDSEETTLDAGLSLIRQFSGSSKAGKQLQHRFIILTAAENFSQAVKDAADLGISSSDYIQKMPSVWRNELLARVHLALQLRPFKLPQIEVFKRTGRVARIEGVEIILDYPLWCLLAVLSESRRGIWNEPKKIAHILYWNYSLNPESRSSLTEDLDPEERIILQLPHYTSELRIQLEKAFMKTTHNPPGESIVLFDNEAGYRLNANGEILDKVEGHFRIRKRPRVLIVEDDLEWVKELETGLQLRGFETLVARSVEEAMDTIRSTPFDLISLDLELPISRDGIHNQIPKAENTVGFLRDLRLLNPHVPIAVLTSIAWRDSIMLDMLRQGVRIDDYLSKNHPMPVEMLSASLARLWQEVVNETRILDWDDTTPLYPIVIDPENKTLISVGGCPIYPAGKGAIILKALSATPNVFISRTELIEIVYGNEDLDSLPDDIDNALNSHLKRLRRTITENTNGNVLGENIVCGDRGVYWLRGIVQ